MGRGEDKLRGENEEFFEERGGVDRGEKRKLLLEKPTPALRMLPGKALREAKADTMARGIVDQRHEVERATIEKRQQETRDDFLRDAAKSREAKARPAIDLTAAFRARAAQKDRQRGDEGRSR